ncbi:MAG TPA: hypothetical protein VNN25_04135 [Thermoanaerobaculia bacterium]|nr:hypothetical protein [Thermoanaerobaculia bacterium]
MRPIGFSTGALAKGDFRSGLEAQRELDGVDAVELSALRDHELATLVEATESLDLHGFTYVSFHAPSKLQTLNEKTVFELLLSLPDAWPLVVHPELLQTPSLWRQLGGRLCIENMDNRKATGRTVLELRELFDTYPSASFCLDLGHARQIDPTMASAILMLRQFGGRLRQLHVSDVGPFGQHLPLGATARRSFARIAGHIPPDCPIIIESIVATDAIERELDAVTTVFESVLAQATA